MQRAIVSLALILLLLTGSGCGDGKKPVVVHPVSGQVFYGGKPVAGVQVYLLPTSAPMIPDIPANPHGVTDAGGKFQLTTFSKNDGAAAGGYQVLLLWPPESSETEETTTDRLLGWYDAVNSRLTAQIKEGPNDLPAFQLPVKTHLPEPSQGVPGRN